MRLFLLAAVLAGCAASSPSDGPSPPEGPETQAQYEAELQALSQQITAAIGEARADDVSRCRLVEVGVKPCGGPWEHRVFSTTDGDPERVLQRVAAYNARNAEMNERFELISTCEYREPPEIALEEGRCVARTP